MIQLMKPKLKFYIGFFVSCAISLFFLLSFLHGQEENPPFRVMHWRCYLPGGTFVVKVNAITSVSSHEYLVNGVARVTEVTVATTASVVARFYYLEPLKPKAPMGIGQSTLDKVQEKIKEGVERVGQEVAEDAIWKKVTKDYPATTHAHTVEYRLESKEDLERLYKSVEKSFLTPQNGSFRLVE